MHTLTHVENSICTSIYPNTRYNRYLGRLSFPYGPIQGLPNTLQYGWRLRNLQSRNVKERGYLNVIIAGEFPDLVIFGLR